MAMRSWSNQSPPFYAQCVSCGSVVYPPGGTYGPRIQQYLQLVILHTGHAEIHIDGQIHHLLPGHVALLHPGHQEEFIFCKEAETWHRWIDVLPQSISNRGEQMLDHLPFAIPLSDAMNQLTDLLYALSHSPGANKKDAHICALGVSSLLLYIAESQQKGAACATHPSFLSVKAEIHENYAKPLTLKTLAQIANVSPEYLIRLFRQYEQITPMRYLWKVRVHRAVELLRNTGLSLAEIAEQTGFQTSYHLSRLVKEHMDATPTEIRRASWRGTLYE
jgi:AraC family transcriptional regulator of arabinose operon